MNKQTYEEIMNLYERLKHTNERGSIGLKYSEYTSSYDAYREDLDKLMEVIKSQKTLEIVVGGVYEIINNVQINEEEVIKKGEVVEVEQFWNTNGFDFVIIKQPIRQILKTQFNQYNFMKVEDK
jgi:hypothetical protein